MTDAVDFTDQVFRAAVVYLVWMLWLRTFIEDRSEKPWLLSIAWTLATFVLLAVGVWISRLLWS